jgi:hypothetical protein
LGGTGAPAIGHRNEVVAGVRAVNLSLDTAARARTRAVEHGKIEGDGTALRGQKGPPLVVFNGAAKWAWHIASVRTWHCRACVSVHQAGVAQDAGTFCTQGTLPHWRAGTDVQITLRIKVKGKNGQQGKQKIECKSSLHHTGIKGDFAKKNRPVRFG